ncbi:hypothetical protein JX265_001644 [Neoarthrinium moseri]|uniref:Cellobiose dehydrogenase-like cytochrome domain-containing protein n=1 Tax=Neoarthrinium moseri TaxID=1658444 RepID=A0A9Q0AUT3_9PEZI|nr:uncharacterized protein JN550_012415 [Neoarthrinium moseri]KAI1851239.1 hypothetical protein JX266_003314 [Neoarthrinium moseri]KAI1858853.1 hypothetical protein JN550_012415 [Neoarthrinium moseri]KAI1880023.1 hypothetical protein JX265_001644 [Neoarthrinium moseri]
MRWSIINFGTAILASLPTVFAADSAVWQDSETGFTFSQYAAAYAIGKSLTFRIAVPSTATSSAAYDAVLQISAPLEVGWTGLAWGGTMVTNPLTVAWANGNSAVATVRWATGHVTPNIYSGAQIQVLRTGTHTNGTHWQVTLKCTGCTSFTGSSGKVTILNPNGANRLAFAYSRTKPSNPSSSSSSFGVHEVTNYWSHDFSSAGNANFAALVTKNS